MNEEFVEGSGGRETESGFWIFSQLTSGGNRMMGLSPLCAAPLCFMSSFVWSEGGQGVSRDGSVLAWLVVLGLGFWGASNHPNTQMAILFQNNTEQRWTPSSPPFLGVQLFSTAAGKVSLSVTISTCSQILMQKCSSSECDLMCTQSLCRWD